eukprot:TRINITY_DN90917_c0_g1_i1.p1 TRINITY_DN90917_c0_g1~~TRINITY_DN90917_c0_g1_i1.p1  ORF type:complete len:523 (+),score=114.27 TRINITY_DN90917_c0_g1_i1:85-1653(+)
MAAPGGFDAEGGMPEQSGAPLVTAVTSGGGARRVTERSQGSLTRRSFVNVMQMPSAPESEAGQSLGVGDEDPVNLPGSYRVGEVRQESFNQQVESLQRQTLLDPAAVRQLEREDPGFVAWLKTKAGLAAQMGLFALYIFMDVGKSLANSFALKDSGVNTTSLVISQSIMSILIGIVITLVIDGAQTVYSAVQPAQLMRFGLVSAMFAAAQCFASLSYKYMDASLIKTLGQARLLQTAILSSIFLRRRYIGAQWATMCVVVLGAMLFLNSKIAAQEAYDVKQVLPGYELDRFTCYEYLSNLTELNATVDSVPTFCGDPVEEHLPDEEKNVKIGLLCTFLYLLISDGASIVSESFLKGDKKLPFYVQKITIEIMGLPISFCMSFFMPWFQKQLGTKEKYWKKDMWWVEGSGGLFRSWSWYTAIALLFIIGQSWMGGIICKKLNSVMKLLGKVCSSACVYVMSDLILQPEAYGHSWSVTQAQMVAVMSTYVFLNIKVPSKPEEPEAPAGDAAASAPAAVEMRQRQ